jgi:hypothetical protein
MLQSVRFGLVTVGKVEYKPVPELGRHWFDLDNIKITGKDKDQFDRFVLRQGNHPGKAFLGAMTSDKGEKIRLLCSSNSTQGHITFYPTSQEEKELAQAFISRLRFPRGVMPINPTTGKPFTRAAILKALTGSLKNN